MLPKWISSDTRETPEKIGEMAVGQFGENNPYWSRYKQP